MRRSEVKLTAQEEGVFAARLRSYQISLEAGGYSRHTISNYSNSLRRFGAYLAAQGMPGDPALVTREHIEGFLMSIQRGSSARSGQAYKANTVLSTYLRLHSFFAWLKDRDEITRSPMENIKPPRVPSVSPEAITATQAKKVLKRCEGKSFRNRRDMAMIRLLIDTGMRLSELANIRLSDIDWSQRAITIMGKGRKQRLCWFGSKSLLALDLYVNWARSKHRHASSPYLWLGQRGRLSTGGIYDIIKGKGKQAGIPGCHPHMFRHFASYAHLQAGGSEVGLMRRMGWASREMVTRYTSGVADELTRDEYNKLGLGDQL